MSDSLITMGSPFATADIMLTDEEIKTLPTTVAILIPPTELLGYSGFPSKLFIPSSAYVLFDASFGDYGNLNQSNRLIVGWGSDFSSDIAVAGAAAQIADTDPIQYSVAAVPLLPTGKSFQTFFISEQQIANDYLQDNAMVVKIDNKGDGILTGGDPRNSMRIVIQFSEVNFP